MKLRYMNKNVIMKMCAIDEMHFDYRNEDIKLIFPDVSYDKEAAQPNRHNETCTHNLLMTSTANNVVHPIK
jgi:hypothetical protein